MKLILVVVAILGFANALPTERGLVDELKEVLDLIDTDAVRAVVADHYAKGSFDNVIAFVRDENMPAYIEAVRNSATLATIKSLLVEHNVDTDALRAFWERIRDLIVLRSAEPSTVATKSIADFWADLKAVLPIDDLKAVWAEKKQTSEHVQTLIAVVKSDEFKGYIAQFAASSEYQAVINVASQHNFDLVAFVQKVRDTFGW